MKMCVIATMFSTLKDHFGLDGDAAQLLCNNARRSPSADMFRFVRILDSVVSSGEYNLQLTTVVELCSDSA